MTKQRRGKTQPQPQQMTAIAANYLAERRGLFPGQKLADWLRAEREIESHLQSGLPSSSG
ncbi:DUF2934 domain-containing protein [Noviherbaspirillum sedimenti]|uniref:DUF2934 domain-containing protein n=1 Tax=Noviherbaspirillum sedimenti TaxID=2320865 RepID=UPI001314CDFC|nr:DUF2934 domain-containing protein [Noviherbaspirillum sedimenti]